MHEHLASLNVGAILDLFVAIAEDLKRRGITRSTNNPVADLAELYFEQGLGLSRAPKSTKGYDATDAKARKYEIKGRRLTRDNPSRELSAIRNIEGEHFDFLAGVLFEENLTVLKACLIPREVVLGHSTHVVHTNSRKFLLRDEIWGIPNVQDVTDQLRAAEKRIRDA